MIKLSLEIKIIWVKFVIEKESKMENVVKFKDWIENNDVDCKIKELPKNSLRYKIFEHVGLKNDTQDITGEMLFDVLKEEIPEFILMIAEENFFRGYNQRKLDEQSLQEGESIA